MKALLYKVGLLIILSVCSFTLRAQSDSLKIDSLKKELLTLKEDSNKVKLLTTLSYYYLQYSADTAADYGQKALDLAKKIDFAEGVYNTETSLASSLMISGNYLLALDNDFKFLSLAQRKKDIVNESIANALIGECYYDLGDFNTSLKYYRENLRLTEICCRDGDGIIFPWANMAHVYHSLNQPDSAILYAKKAFKIARGGSDTLFTSNVLGDAYAGKGNYDSALYQYRLSIDVSLRNHIQLEQVDGYNGIANVYKTTNEPDSATIYSKKVLAEKIEKSYPLGLLRAANMLADIYGAQSKPDSTLKYLRVALAIKDNLFGREKTMAIQNLAYKEQEKQKEVAAAKLQSENQLKMYALLGGLFALLVIAGILFRTNKQKLKANTKIEKAYVELKSTQAQLIQSEKMASLGELTAGIAHEIQNPLNFVNNFSEVNKELVEELQSELKSGNTEEALAISNDIKDNEEKINHHGRRADSIVKGMLQHSRQTSGQKEPTDINALCDEYLRLSYHGLRAKDKSFNADFKTDFDESIGKINIVPQDMGRVLLNLFNNAFYACTERSRSATGEKQKAESLKQYEPLVSVQTKKINDKVEIIVSDNGNGIPQNIIDKIFQPFFTTKPTGEGTGLGLSLAYDIITKQHNGTIKVESKADEGNPDGFGKDNGTTFIIQLEV